MADRPRSAPILLGALLLAAACGVGDAQRPWPGPIADALAAADTAAVLLLFTLPDCPISDRYAPAIREIVADYGPRGVRAFAIYPRAGLEPAEAAAHTAAFDLPLEVVLDPDRSLVERLGATVSSETAVLDPAGRVRYRGRIDDRFVDFGKIRPAATTRELRDALDAVLDDREVPVPRTPAVGCFLDPLHPGGGGGASSPAPHDHG